MTIILIVLSIFVLTGFKHYHRSLGDLTEPVDCGLARLWMLAEPLNLVHTILIGSASVYALLSNGSA